MIEKIKNYIKVNEKVGTSGQPTKQEIKTIAKNGYEVVINLAMHNKEALKREDKLVSKQGMIYIHIPIHWEKPEVERLKFALELLKVLEEENKKVFIHCIMNWRVSVLMYHYKKDVLKQKNHKLIAPNDFKINKTWKKILKMNFQ